MDQDAKIANPFIDLATRLERLEQGMATLIALVETAPKADPMPELLTRKQAAQYLSMTVQSVDALCRSGALEKVYVGGSPRFRRQDIRKLSRSGGEGENYSKQ